MDSDAVLRTMAFARLDDLVEELGPRLTRAELRNVLEGVSSPHLVDRQKGIWNPGWLDATLSVLTMPEHSYDDRELGQGVWAYSYRAGSTGGDNKKLRAAREMQVDIIYFRPVSPLLYEPIYPVRVMEDYPDRREVILVRRDVDLIESRGEPEPEVTYLREWRERTVLERKHQDDFRKRVMRAYRRRCTVCRLGHEELLDAAHIDTDKSEFGDPVTNNGLALCKLHHRAYDSHIIGISPDFEVHVRDSILAERDGPMLRHGLQEMHGTRIELPRQTTDHPSRDRLERRYEAFQQARV